MTRWEALVRFDDEIGDAAAKLIPFGAVWVDKLGEAFFALDEDRTYLPNIVARLQEEAEFAVLEAKRNEEREWLLTFSEVGSEKTSNEALAILIELKARGYVLEKGWAGRIEITVSGRGTSYLYSNDSVVEFGKIALRKARE